MLKLRTRLIAVAAFAASLAQSPLNAQTVPNWASGTIKSIYVDPSKVVIELSAVGPCGGTFYEISRSAVNFTEIVSLMYTAAASGKQVLLWVVGCSGTRADVSHGQAIFQ